MSSALPAGVARTLLVLGVIGALALPSLSAAFGWRLANGFGVELEPSRVFVQPLENGTRVGFVFDAFKPEREMELNFVGGNGMLLVDGARVPVESVTGRSVCDAEGCFRGVTFTFLLAEGRALEGEWSLSGSVRWESDFLEVASSMRVAASGEGSSFG